MNPRIGWGPPPPAWQAPGWAPLVDPGPRPLQVVRSLGRWWWPTLTVAGLLAVLTHVVDHDPARPGLSSRGLLTVALAAAVVALLTLHRRYGPWPLARAVAEYATVALPCRRSAPTRRASPAALGCRCETARSAVLALAIKADGGEPFG